MDSSLIEIQSVTKRYGKQTAVNAVSFSVPRGGIMGLLGPNGAGKTSIIRMLTGITIADEGKILVNGEPISHLHQNIMGYMPEERGLYKKLNVQDQLEYLGSLKGLTGSDLKDRIDYWLKRFEITEWRKKKTNELSKGMQQKLQFIVTVLHNPELLILDEPLSGLDPINAEIINEIIMELRAQGKTILLSTHRMEQVEELCEEIVLINLGRIVLQGKVRELKAKSGKNVIALAFHGNDAFLSSLPAKGLEIVEHTPTSALLRPVAGFDPRSALSSIAALTEVRRWEFIEPPLKELFLEAVNSMH